MRTTLEIGDSGLALGGLEWKDKCDREKKKGKKPAFSNCRLISSIPRSSHVNRADFENEC